eukprot:UN07203
MIWNKLCKDKFGWTAIHSHQFGLRDLALKYGKIIFVERKHMPNLHNYKISEKRLKPGKGGSRAIDETMIKKWKKEIENDKKLTVISKISWIGILYIAFTEINNFNYDAAVNTNI